MTPEERFEQLDIKLRDISDILAETAALNAETAALSKKTEAGLRKTDDVLRRAICLAAREARGERERRRIADERLDQMFTRLAAVQAVTEEKLQRFLESRTHHNGGNQPQ